MRGLRHSFVNSRHGPDIPGMLLRPKPKRVSDPLPVVDGRRRSFRSGNYLPPVICPESREQSGPDMNGLVATESCIRKGLRRRARRHTVDNRAKSFAGLLVCDLHEAVRLQLMASG